MGCACGGSTRRWAATSGWHRRGQPLGRGAGGPGGSLRDPEQPGQAANGGGLVWGSPPPSPLSGRSCGSSAARRPAPRRCASLTSATACVWSAHRPYPKGSRSSHRRQALVPPPDEGPGHLAAATGPAGVRATHRRSEETRTTATFIADRRTPQSRYRTCLQVEQAWRWDHRWDCSMAAMASSLAMAATASRIVRSAGMSRPGMTTR
jgi:hypothetical protein